MQQSWTKEAILELYHTPLMDLMYRAASVHRTHHDPNTVQVSTLLSIKTGGCPEDCGYCPQAARYHTDLEGNELMSVSQVKAQALRAKASGSSRVCMGAAWRNVKDGPEFDNVLEMVRTINKLDMEVCCTLGMLTENQAKRLAEAGLYAYNHNLDTSEDYYKEELGYQDDINKQNNAQALDQDITYEKTSEGLVFKFPENFDLGKISFEEKTWGSALYLEYEKEGKKENFQYAIAQDWVRYPMKEPTKFLKVDWEPFVQYIKERQKFTK